MDTTAFIGITYLTHRDYEFIMGSKNQPVISNKKEPQMRFAFTTLFLILFSTTAIAAQYNFMPPEDLKQRLGANEDLVIVDIQIEEEFNQHHIPGSIATYAYPVKNEEDRARLEPVVSLQKEDSKSLVIVCPRGAGGAKRTFDYLVAQGVDESRLWILEKGMSGWKYGELTAANE
jgi:thiosulfate/3-mercaptopyruvate sulfurtransferase